MLNAYVPHHCVQTSKFTSPFDCICHLQCEPGTPADAIFGYGSATSVSITIQLNAPARALLIALYAQFASRTTKATNEYLTIKVKSNSRAIRLTYRIYSIALAGWSVLRQISP